VVVLSGVAGSPVRWGVGERLLGLDEDGAGKRTRASAHETAARRPAAVGAHLAMWAVGRVLEPRVVACRVGGSVQLWGKLWCGSSAVLFGSSFSGSSFSGESGSSNRGRFLCWDRVLMTEFVGAEVLWRPGTHAAVTGREKVPHRIRSGAKERNRIE
jgi:hypothetical protein